MITTTAEQDRGDVLQLLISGSWRGGEHLADIFFQLKRC